MSDITNGTAAAEAPTIDELTAVLRRLLDAYFAERELETHGETFDGLRSAMFFILYMASADAPSSDEELIVGDALKQRPMRAFIAADRVIDMVCNERAAREVAVDQLRSLTHPGCEPGEAPWNGSTGGSFSPPRRRSP